jgi:hypothetical protein
MNVYRLLQYFLPLQNPIGFGLADFLELGFTLLAVLVLVSQRKSEAILHWIAERPAVAMAILAVLPAVLRLLLLPHHPVPVPAVADDFSFLLLGDTLAHFRLANPPHPMSRFFETVFVLHDPTYSSIYPLGQGMALAIGELLFRLPWAGVVLSVSLLASFCYWMLRAWVRPVWALAGGLLCVMEFGPLNQWMNNYWGGAVSAIAGCLVFGALPRLWTCPRRRDAILLGIGIGFELLTRPWEFVLLSLCLLPVVWRVPVRFVIFAVLAFLPAAGLTLAQNKAVTGSFTTLPYMLSRTQYGIPTTFTFQKIPQPSHPLNQEQEMDYRAQVEVHRTQPETLSSFCKRLADRVRFYRFYFYPPLFVALLFFLPALREVRFVWVAGCVVVFALGSNLYPYFYPHYIAVLTCVFVLFSVAGLERLSRRSGDAMRFLALLCVAQFTFWYGIHFFGNDDIFIATGQYESWDYINFGDQEGRIAIDRKLAAAPGQQLVFVRFSPRHLLREWVHNEANIDGSRVVWALDLGPEEDAKLMRYYPQRTVWLIQPDSRPPKLSPYPSPAP